MSDVKSAQVLRAWWVHLVGSWIDVSVFDVVPTTTNTRPVFGEVTGTGISSSI